MFELKSDALTIAKAGKFISLLIYSNHIEGYDATYFPAFSGIKCHFRLSNKQSVDTLIILMEPAIICVLISAPGEPRRPCHVDKSGLHGRNQQHQLAEVLPPDMYVWLNMLVLLLCVTSLKLLDTSLQHLIHILCWYCGQTYICTAKI